VALFGPGLFRGHHVAEELCDVASSGVLRVAHVLPVVASGLRRVVLQGNEVETDVVETGFAFLVRLPGGHGVNTPGWTALDGVPEK
jgi:hypothetical protein